MKSLRHIVPTLAALTLAVVLSGCGKDSSPTGVNPGLDGTPPAAVTQIGVSQDPADGAPTLDWSPSSSPNVSFYEVHIYSPNPDRDLAYMKVAETDANTTWYRLPVVSAPTVAYYRVRAKTGNGSMSSWSPIAVVELTPPPVGTSGTSNGGNGLPRSDGE